MIQVASYQEVSTVKTTVSLLGQRLNVYLFYLDGLLIDAGPSRMKSQLVPFFQEKAIEQVVLTHHHEDHTGLAPWLEQHKKMPIYIHQSGIAVCEKSAQLPFYRTLFWGKRQAFSPKPLPCVISTDKYKFEVLHTPGHADDHVVFYNRENGLLFSGDAYLTSRPKTLMRTESIRQIMESLRAMLKLDFTTLFCSHAGVLENGRAKLEAKLANLEEVTGEVLNLHSKGYSVKAICQKLYPQTYPISYLSGFELSPRHIVTSILESR